MASNVVERAMGLGLTVIREVAGAEWIEKAGLRPQVEKLMNVGAKQAARGMTAVAKSFGGKPRAKEERLSSEPALDDFDLEPTEEQELVLDTARRFAAEVLEPAAHRCDVAQATSPDILASAHELGLTSLVVPEALGGAASTHGTTTLVLAAEALARGDAGITVAILAPVGVASLLADHGTPAQQGKYIPAFVGEKYVAATVAVHEPGVLFDPSKPTTRAKKDGEGFVLDGVKSLVPLAASAELFLVSAALPTGGAGLFLVDGGTSGLSVAGEPAMGLRAAAFGTLTLSGVRVGKDALLGGDDAKAALADAIDRSRIAWSALAVGTSQAVLDYVVPYTNDRQAFGDPISTKQSVAFMVADIAIELEGMRLLTYRAASRVDAKASFKREAFLARLQTSEKGMQIGSNGIQLLGGHGFITEYPVERWYRQLRGVGMIEGGIVV